MCQNTCSEIRAQHVIIQLLSNTILQVFGFCKCTQKYQFPEIPVFFDLVQL